MFKTLKIIIPAIIIMLLVQGTLAATCYTIPNTPQNNKYYWSAITYDKINDEAPLLEKTEGTVLTSGLSIGLQYNLYVNQNCFANYLPKTEYGTGSTSGGASILRQGDDYKTNQDPTGIIYTISVQEQDNPSLLVQQIPTCTINSINYCTNPSTLTNPNLNKEYLSFIQGICHSDYTIKEQMELINYKIWNNIAIGTPDCSSYNSRIQCILVQKKATDQDYALLSTVIARGCGIPSRVAYGISQGTFNGIDLLFPDNKIHYWTQYYNQGWQNSETSQTSSSPSDLETNCQDSIDNDFDNNKDCYDLDCNEALACTGSNPTTTNYINQYSTKLGELPNAYNVNLLEIGDYYGTITWKDKQLDLRNLNLDGIATFEKDKITFRDSIPLLNKPVIITMRHISYDTPIILKNGQNCTECNITTMSFLTQTITYNAPGPGIYSLTATNATTNITNLPPAPPGTTSVVINWKKPWEAIKALWNKIPFGETTKIIVLIAIILIGYWWYKRSRRNAIYKRFGR